MDSKNTYTEVFLKAAGLPNNNIEKYRSVWWCNLREKNANGLRLTDQGIEFVETHAEIKTYNIDLPKELKITPQILVWLDHYIQSPFYLGRDERVRYTSEAITQMRRGLDVVTLATQLFYMLPDGRARYAGHLAELFARDMLIGGIA